MYRGQKVEVGQILISGGHTGKHIYYWSQGYKYVRPDGKSHLVRATEGLFEGCIIRFDAVRPIFKRKKA